MKKCLFIVSLISAIASASGNYVDKDEQWSFSDFKTVLLEHKVNRIEDLLPLLPSSYLYSYTLAHSSRSLHESSSINPRAILFGATANLVLTFNGDPSQRAYESLEILSYETGKAEFREIIFRGDHKVAKGKAPESFVGSVDEVTLDPSDFDPDHGGVVEDNFLISKPNPSKCMNCHSMGSLRKDIARPIFESYPRWPSLFGSEDDRIWDPFGEQGSIFSNDNIFWNYKSRAAHHPRYKHLAFEVDGNDHFPYHGLTADFERAGYRTYEFMPNTRLGILLGFRYSYQLALEVYDSSYYLENKQLIWTALCEPDSHGALHLQTQLSDEFALKKQGIYEDPRSDQSGKLLPLILAASGIPYGNTSMALAFQPRPETSFPGMDLRYYRSSGGVDDMVVNQLIRLEAQNGSPEFQAFLREDTEKFKQAYYSLVPRYLGDPIMESVIGEYYDFVFSIFNYSEIDTKRGKEVCHRILSEI